MHVNTEIRTLHRFEDAGLNPEQSEAMAVGVEDLLVQSFALFNNRMDALESLMRFQMAVCVGVAVAFLIGSVGLICAMPS